MCIPSTSAFRRYDHAIIAEVIQAIFNIQGMLKQVELLVFVNDFFCQAVTVEGFSSKTKYRLKLYIPGFCDGTAG
jgi:hypothetical protein